MLRCEGVAARQHASRFALDRFRQISVALIRFVLATARIDARCTAAHGPVVMYRGMPRSDASGVVAQSPWKSESPKPLAQPGLSLHRILWHEEKMRFQYIRHGAYA
ncbi:hypothetical protein [Burkholderia alba]|uniref:hypothetical protein n=1 Tax=Burkholderia alba TaxID=2683677 RepID=UPI002B053E45|nr:hypothetical protein [Burkholderia alba]